MRHRLEVDSLRLRPANTVKKRARRRDSSHQAVMTHGSLFVVGEGRHGVLLFWPAPTAVIPSITLITLKGKGILTANRRWRGTASASPRLFGFAHLSDRRLFLSAIALDMMPSSPRAPGVRSSTSPFGFRKPTGVCFRQGEGWNGL